MKTEKICAEHLEGAAALEALCFPDPWSAKALELLLTEEASGAVILQEGAVVAYGGIYWAPDEGQITNVAVHPDCRRQGLGAQILQALIAEANARACMRMVLEVRASNEAAIALYRRYGFFEVGRRKAFYRAPREDALIMELSLGTDKAI